MRKILISIVVCLLLVMTGFFIVSGNDIIKTKGILELMDANKALDSRIEELSQTSSTTYQGAIANLENAVNALLESKTEYETQAILAALNDTNYTSEMYSVDFIWTRLGNFAKDEQIDMDLNAYSTGVEHLYDLKFIVDGTYLGITNFIYDIENDSKLGFKIDDFYMTGLEGNKVRATFTCEGIYINIANLPNPSTGTETDSNTTSEANTNNTTTNTTTGADTNSTADANSTVDTNSTIDANSTTETKTENTVANEV